MSLRSPKFWQSDGFSLLFSGKYSMCCEADTCRSESKQKIRMNFRNTSTQICISKPLDVVMCLSRIKARYLKRFVLKGGQPRRCISQYIKMRCRWGTHGERSTLCIHLVVNQTPLLQKCMNPEQKTIFFSVWAKNCFQKMCICQDY